MVLRVTSTSRSRLGRPSTDLKEPEVFTKLLKFLIMLNKQHQPGAGGNGPVLPPTIIINEQEFSWSGQFITGRDIRQLAGLSDAADIYLAITDPWDDERIELDTRVDLGREGIEAFYERRPLPLVIEGREYTWNRQYISGASLRKLGNIDPQDEIFLMLQRPYEDERIEDKTVINLARPGIEHFRVKKKGEDILVGIRINDHPYTIKRGKHTVAELKKLDKVPLADELSELVKGKLVPLADDATVHIKGGEEFFSCKREGSSS
jgi:hypothetical protein